MLSAHIARSLNTYGHIDLPGLKTHLAQVLDDYQTMQNHSLAPIFK